MGHLAEGGPVQFIKTVKEPLLVLGIVFCFFLKKKSVEEEALFHNAARDLSANWNDAIYCTSRLSENSCEYVYYLPSSGLFWHVSVLSYHAISLNYSETPNPSKIMTLI